MDYTGLKKKCSEEYIKIIKDELDVIKFPSHPHTIGGYAYVHSIPNYHRIETEGLNSYKKRILKLKDSDFKNGLLCLFTGIENFHSRALEKLKEGNAPKKLISALEKVPFSPAETLYEAIVCRNFVYYLDYCDDPGRLDAELIEFYKGEDITDLLREFFTNVDINNGWSSALGPDYNDLTVQVLRASRGMRRPSVELRVTKDMPDELWEEAVKAIKAGGGSPSLYNEELYQQALKEKFPYIPESDLLKFNGGGCTETMLAGISRVGSLDAGINTVQVLRETLTSSLCSSETYNDFYEKLFENLKTAVENTHKILSYVYEQRTKEVAQPMRTLLVDDCIENETDFHAGGARYNWSIVNFAGTINVIDSLLAIKELIYDKKKYTQKEFLSLLDNEDEEFFTELKKCRHYGVDDEIADSLAAEFSERLFGLLDNYKPYFGDCYLPASIQFTTYLDAGKGIGPTPDGRKNNAPLCDSLAAIHSNDNKGPTALLNSVSKLSLSKALGTPVLNLSLSPEHITASLKPLITSFFEKGGMQAQITCVSKEDMLDALKNPDKHKNLIVRVGGYSEYFNNLSDELKQTVIERTIQI